MKQKNVIVLATIFFMPFFMALLGSLSPSWRSTSGLKAQQLPFSSQYYINPFVVNPAFTGTGEYTNAYLSHRSQWTGLAGAPQTSYLTVDGPMRMNNNSGLGLKVYTDVTDIISRVGAFANYSYKLKLNDSSHVLFGIGMGVLNNKLDFSKAIIKDNNDPFLYQQSKSRTVFSADLGVAYIWKRLTVGFAVPQVLGNRVKYTILNDDNSYYNFSRHYHGTIKYEFDLVKEKGITAYPLVMLRAVKGGPFQYDINGVVDWKDKGWVGLTYHSTYAFAISAGVRYRNFTIGYAYDLGINRVRSYLGTTSEFLLGYTFNEKKRPGNLPDMDEPGRDTITVAKINKDTIYSIVAAQLKAITDSNKAEMDRLKAELAKAKAVEPVAGTAANSGPQGYITGRLLDEQGNPVPDAQVEVINKANNQVVARPFTTADGTVRIAVPVGQTYDVVFNKSGYLYKPMNVTVPETAGAESGLNDVTMQKLEVGKKVVLNNILFDLNKAILKPESYSELDQTAKLVKEIPSLEMEVSGHTDNIGSAESNQELSEQRAKAVMDYMISKGADRDRLSYKGYGASQPIADNSTENGRKTNRRTEFKVLKVDGQYTVVSGADAVGEENQNGVSVANPQNDAAIAQLKAKSDSYQEQIEQLRQELAKVKSTPDATNAVNPENTVLMTQLKAKSDSNQVQIERLQAELAKAKATETAGSSDAARLTQLKAESDSNKVQIERLKVELAKNATSASPADEARISELKTKSDNNQLQIEQLKAELAKSKPATNAEDVRIAQLKAKSDSNQVEIERLKAELAISKTLSKLSTTDDTQIAKLKEKSDTNQLQIEQLKWELTKVKLATMSNNTSTDNTAAIAQLKAQSDSNEVQLERLKSELAKAKTTGSQLPATTANDEAVAQLKTKTDAYQAEIDKLKADLEKVKNAETKTPATPANDASIAELKTKSDSYQAEINQLKTELEKVKNSSAKAPADPANDAAVAQLKAKSDTYQTEIEQLKAEIEKLKGSSLVNNSAAAEKERQLAQLKAKADADLAEANRLKNEQEKEKEKANSTISAILSNPGTTTNTTTNTTTTTTSTPGVRSYKTTDFLDDKGKAVTTGFYVVIGTFGSKENADKFRAASIMKGHGTTKIIQNQNSKVYNITIVKTNNKEDADAERAKYKAEYPDLWILKLE